MKRHDNNNFIVVMFSFVVIIGNNANTQSDKFKEKEQSALAAEVNMTNKMKFLCLQIDVNGKIDQIEDKEQQAQCEKFLDNVSIYELNELIDKFH